MKKITMIFLALLSLNLFAAFQYQVSGYGGGYFSFDGTTSLKMDRPGVHKGLDYLFVKNSLVLGDNSWGYYLHVGPETCTCAGGRFSRYLFLRGQNRNLDCQ